MRILTFDTDWVPQFMLDRCLEILEDHGVTATVFCTGPYDLGPAGLVEAAIHPNFMPGSTQGDSPETVVGGLKAIYPEAVGSRSHKYHWHSDIRPLLLAHGIEYDCTQLLPGQPHLSGFMHLGLKRFSTWWSDNLHLYGGWGLDAFAPEGLAEPGLKILDFHPIHVYLNTPGLGWYRGVMAGLPRVPEMRERHLRPLRHDGPGIGTLLEIVVRGIAATQGRGRNLSDLAADVTADQPGSTVLPG